MRITGFFLLCGLIATMPASAGTIAKLESPEIQDLQITGFELDRELEVTIDAVGIRQRNDGPPAFLRWLRDDDEKDSPWMSVYAWLLDADTRQPLWVMNAGDTNSAGGNLRSAEATVRLSPGRYELYLASTHRWAHGAEAGEEDEGRDDRWWSRLLGDRRRVSDLREELPDCHVTLSADGVHGDRLHRFEPTGELHDGLLSVNRVGDSRLEVHGIAVNSSTTIGLYGVFEQLKNDDQPADFGWIIDEATREVVWRADRSDSRPAGGASKNRLIDAELSLGPGRYLVHVGTDDSHAFGSFNSAPPNDPLNWGLTLRAGDGFAHGSVEMFDPVIDGAALIDFSQAGDDELLEQPFRMKRDGVLHVRAFGEYSDGQFFDRAWIVDASNNGTAWEMTGRTTMPAGGADKNRMFDGLVVLPRGDYVLYYVSDGSHAYGSWNNATPFEPEGWGVVVRPTGSTAADDIELISESDLQREEGLLARITRVGDDEREIERFTIDEPTRVMVYAQGEGGRGSMHDYGWILDQAGRIVWEMAYRDTEHAGGDDKNRMVRHEMTLEPGQYEIRYESDGSHSFRGWNADPPNDPMSWGITVRRAKGRSDGSAG